MASSSYEVLPKCSSAAFFYFCFYVIDKFALQGNFTDPSVTALTL